MFQMIIKPELYLNMMLINCSGLIAQTIYVILVKYFKKKMIICKFLFYIRLVMNNGNLTVR